MKSPRLAEPRLCGTLLVAGLALVAVIAGCARRDREAEPGLRDELPPSPGLNVLVVSFDALRADRLGAYGYPRPVSPHLDAFAREAIVFERASAVAQATPTSFAAAFTGRWPSRVFRGWRLAPVPNLAGVFAAGGYDTAFFSNNVQLVTARGFDQGFERYEILVGVEGESEQDRIAKDEVVLERVVRWLREEASPPFLSWVHFLSPHSPYDYRPEANHLYRTPTTGRFAQTTGPEITVESSADLDRVEDLYDGEVWYADGLFGRLLAALEATGRRGDTLVVITSDHGEELADHGGFQHGTVYEEILRVPLIVGHPRGARGLRSGLPMSHVDLLPTLAEIAGLEPPGEIDGVSLLAPLDAGRLRLAQAMTHRTDHYVAVTRGTDKAILDCARGTGALYDLAADPRETADRLDRRPRVYRELVNAAKAALGEEPCRALVAAIDDVPAEVDLDTATIERLRALGYLADGGSAPAPPPPSDYRFWAEPNPIRVCDGLPLGQTVLYWNLTAPPFEFEIRVDAPDGKLMAKVEPRGFAPTGRWVRDGMEFFVV
ncbi:MAG: sulfatase, partial [Vicinamibacteria bacterium]